MGSMTGKNVVITGASDGIGRVTAQKLAEAGANVVMVGRNEAKTVAAARAIMSDIGQRTVTWEIADLSRQHDVRDLAARLRDRLNSIDVLINNAGAIFHEREVTRDGLERTFALNHLAYFTLTLLLLDRLKNAAKTNAPARVLIVSSDAHRRAQLNLGDLQSESNFRPWRTYGNSKLENILFMRSLAAKVDPRKIVVNALHPGVVSTRFAVTGNGVWGRLMRRTMNLASISAEEGADTLVWLATDPEIGQKTGLYWEKRAVATPSKAALNDENARILWNESEKIAELDADALVEQNFPR
ncbi:MAG: SDR family NAD(P)-dependent oxidoreductase [Gemmatimonadaceae bacterium]